MFASRLTVGLLGLVLLAGTAAAQVKDLKISHQFKQGDSRDEAVRLFVKEARNRDSSLKFRIYPGGSLISAPIEQLAAMQDGSVEMAVYPINYGAGKVRAFSFSTMPGLIRSIEHGAALKDSAFGRALQDIAMANGVRIVAWWWTPLGFVMRDRELRGPDSVAGLKLRGADALVDLILRENGASVQAMAGTELYTAMLSGIIDGFVTSTESMYTNRFYEVGKNATLGGAYSFATSMQPLMMSRKHWDTLTDTQKKAIEEAASISEKYFADVQRAAEEKANAAFAKAGVRVHPLTADEYKVWVESAKKLAWPVFAREVPNGAELLKLADEVK